MNLGAFHDVLHISADQRFLQILNKHLVMFLIPLIHPPTRLVRIHNMRPPSPIPPTEEGVLHLDHIEIHDVVSRDNPHLSDKREGKAKKLWSPGAGFGRDPKLTTRCLD